MNREKELVNNTVVLAIGRLLPQFTTFITLPILTACLSKAEYGTYDLISTLIMLVIPIATLQIQSAAFRFLIDYRGDRAACVSIISNIFVITVPVSIVSGIILPFFFGELPVHARMLLGVYFLLDTLYLTMGQIVRGLGENRCYSVASIMLSVVNMICIIIAVRFMGMGLTGLLVGLCFANGMAAAYLGYSVRIWRYIQRFAVSAQKVGELLAYSWPMVPHNLSHWVLKLSDRLVITTFLGVEANAVYAVANKIPNLLSVMQGVIVMAWQENASRSVHDSDAAEYYTRMFERVFFMMIGVTAVLIGLVPMMFRLLIHGDYMEAYPQIPILILAMFFYCMSAFQGGIYIAHKKTSSVGFTTMGAAGINLLVDFLLVNRIGITAGSVSTLVAYLLLFVFRMADVLRFQQMRYNIPMQMLCYLIVGMMLFICFLQNGYLNIINAIAGIVVFGTFNFSVIRGTLTRFMRMINRWRV